MINYSLLPPPVGRAVVLARPRRRSRQRQPKWPVGDLSPHSRWPIQHVYNGEHSEVTCRAPGAITGAGHGEVRLAAVEGLRWEITGAPVVQRGPKLHAHVLGTQANHNGQPPRAQRGRCRCSPAAGHFLLQKLDYGGLGIAVWVEGAVTSRGLVL
jgi:hypothetical protein